MGVYATWSNRVENFGYNHVLMSMNPESLSHALCMFDKIPLRGCPTLKFKTCWYGDQGSLGI